MLLALKSFLVLLRHSSNLAILVPVSYNQFLVKNVYWILERFQNPPFLCVHIDQMRFQKSLFLWISIFDRIFENLRFSGIFVQINLNTFTKTEVLLSVCVQKRSSVNGA